MTLGTILLILFIILLIGALPTWPYSSGWGYYPSGGAGIILVVVIVLLLMGRIEAFGSRTKKRKALRGTAGPFLCPERRLPAGSRLSCPRRRQSVYLYSGRLFRLSLVAPASTKPLLFEVGCSVS